MAVDLAEASYVVESDSFGGVLSAFQNSLKLLFSQHFMISRIVSNGEPTLKNYNKSSKNIPAVAAAVELVTAG